MYEAAHFPALMQITGDVGARDYLRVNQDVVHYFHVCGRLADLDFPSDFES